MTWPAPTPDYHTRKLWKTLLIFPEDSNAWTGGLAFSVAAPQRRTILHHELVNAAILPIYMILELSFVLVFGSMFWVIWNFDLECLLDSVPGIEFE